LRPPAQVEEPALPSPAAKVTKAGKLQALLTTPEGATLAGLCDALGWQSHTVRAALTRLRQAGHSVERGRAGDGRTVYRIVPIGSGEAPDASSDADVTVELIFSSKRTAAPSLIAAQDGEGA
jgi:predicted ArsR family transcriptional regulator